MKKILSILIFILTVLFSLSTFCYAFGRNSGGSIFNRTSSTAVETVSI